MHFWWSWGKPKKDQKFKWKTFFPSLKNIIPISQKVVMNPFLQDTAAAVIKCHITHIFSMIIQNSSFLPIFCIDFHLSRSLQLSSVNFLSKKRHSHMQCNDWARKMRVNDARHWKILVFLPFSATSFFIFLLLFCLSRVSTLHFLENLLFLLRLHSTSRIRIFLGTRKGDEGQISHFHSSVNDFLIVFDGKCEFY